MSANAINPLLSIIDSTLQSVAYAMTKYLKYKAGRYTLPTQRSRGIESNQKKARTATATYLFGRARSLSDVMDFATYDLLLR